MTQRTRLTHRSALGLAVAGVLAGGVLAGTGIALAADNSVSADASGSAATSSAATSSAAPVAPPTTSGGVPGGTMPDRHGASPVRPDEQAVSGTQAAAITAAAEAAVPGGTVYRVETDAGDAAYEAHMTKADGSEVTVKLDESLAVTAVEDGMGLGDPASAGAPAGGPAAGGPASGATGPQGAPSATTTG